MSRALVMPCAGSGERFRKTGGSGPKQLMDLAGLPVFLHGLKIFFESGLFDEFLLVVSPGEEPTYREWLSGSTLTARGLPPALTAVRLVHGGAERWQSVMAGLMALSPKCRQVFIHDAARPLLHPEDLAGLAAVSKNSPDGWLPGEPPRDTIKQVDEKGLVTAHLVRSQLRAVGTPQVFPVGTLQKAYRDFLAKGAGQPTDDAEVFGLAGHAVRIHPFKHPNPKITTGSDLTQARALLEERLRAISSRS